MLSPLVSRRWSPVVILALIVGGAVGSLSSSRPSHSRSESERLQSKLATRVGARFDQPDLAAEFYANRRTGPLLTRGPNATTGARPLNPAAYLPALQQMRGMPRFSSATNSVLPSYSADPSIYASPGGALGTWSSLGPSNQGGRTRALLIDPTNPSVMYAGGVAGGVWKSTNAGATWVPLSDLMANIAISTLAFDPLNASTIYAGTGEGFYNGDAIRGAGIFKSIDAGITWNQIASTNNPTFHYTMSIVVSPRDSQRIFAATRAGLFRTTNGGASWFNVIPAPADGCTQVVLQPSGATGFVFVSCGISVQGTVYRGGDDNASAFSSVLSMTGQGRSSLAIAPSNQSVVYVMSAQYTAGGGPGIHGLHGVYRSTTNGDAGSFTTQVNGRVTPVSTAQKINQLLLSNPIIALLTECGDPTASFYVNQGWYDNVIAVDPLDTNRVWAGGIDLFRSDDGGATWGAAGYWWIPKGSPEYHHADQHGIVFHPQYNGTSNKVMYSTSDGGVDRIDDARAPVNMTLASLCGTPVAGSPTWVDRNNGYVTSQYYDGAAYPDGQTYFGGMQDNGTQRGSLGNANWSILTGGDGGHVAVDTLGDGSPGNDVLFAEYTRLSLQKSTNGGLTFSSAVSGITESSNNFQFIAPFAMNPASKQHLWTGGYYVWRTTNQAASWVRASAITCGQGSVSAVAAHPLDANRVLVGMSDGCYHYNHSALSASSTTAWPGGGFIAGAYISSMAWDPTDINVAYATVSAFNVSSLLKSTNGGLSWSPRVGSGATALPQIPALAVVVNPTDSQQVYVGTDLGVFTSVDGGASWYLENTGFAHVPVEALKINETAPHHVYAFTHGRGAWRVTPGGGTAPTATNDTYNTGHNTTLNVAAPGVLGNDNENGGGTMTAVLESTTASGTLTLNTNGGFTFVPATGSSGPVTFTYRASNSGGVSGVATVTITVAGTAPIAANDSYTVGHNGALNIAAPGVLGNDNANGGGTMTATLISNPTSGTVTLQSTGAFFYVTALGFSGPATFTYRASNAGGQSNVATVTITVNGPLPVPVGDSFDTPFNTPLNVPAPGVLANDNANGGGTMSAVLTSQANLGTVALNANGGFLYTPPSWYSGSASFTYAVSTAVGQSAGSAVVTINIGPQPQTPPGFSLHPANRTVLVGQTALFSAGMTGFPQPTCQWQGSSDFGATWANLAFSSTYGAVTSPTLIVWNASLALSGTQVRCMASNANGSLASNPATLSVAVIAPGVIATGAWTGSISAGNPFTFTANAGTGQGNLTNLSYGSSDGCIASTVTYPIPIAITANTFAHQSTGIGLCTNATRTISGTFGSPTAASGTVVHDYAITPPFGCNCSGTYRTLWSASTGPPLGPQFVVHPDNQNPGAGQNAQFTAAATGTPTAAFQWEMSTNAGSSWTDVPTASPYSGGATPTLTILSSAVAGLNGAQFRAHAQNASGSATSNHATLGSIGSVPTSMPDAHTAVRNTTLNVVAPGVLGNDSTNGGGAMTAERMTPASNGTVSLNANGSFSYTPNTGFVGGDSFTYRAINTVGPGNTATVAITVIGGPTGAPISVNDSYATGFNTALIVSAPGVLSNDDGKGDVMTAALGLTTQNGVLSLANNGSFTYTPNTGFSGVDTFTYRASNSTGPGTVATVSITVSPDGAPSDFRILAMSGNNVTFAWTLPTSGPAPTAIQLEGGLTPGSVLGALPLGVTPSATIALPTGSFYIRLRAIAGGVLSGPSNELFVNVNVPVPPSAPANLLGLVNGGAVQLAWTPTFGGGAPTGSILDVTGALSASLALGPGETFSFPAVPPGTYTFRMRQTNGGGASDPSGPVTLTFPGGCSGAPLPAAKFFAYKAGGMLYLHWDPPASGAAPSTYLLNVTGSFVGTFPMGGRSFSVAAPPGTFTFSIVSTNACGASAATPTQTVSFP